MREYEIRRYLKKLQKVSGLNSLQLKREQSELSVFSLLLKVYPYSVTFEEIVKVLKKKASRKTISNVLKTFQDENIIDRASEQVIPELGQYKRTLYRLNLDKYCSREFQPSARSYLMKGLEQYPNLLYGMALGLKTAQTTSHDKKERQELGKQYIKAFNEDSGVQNDIQRIVQKEGKLWEQFQTLRRKRA